MPVVTGTTDFGPDKSTYLGRSAYTTFLGGKEGNSTPITHTYLNRRMQPILEVANTPSSHLFS